MGDGLLRIVLIGHAAGKDHIAGHPVAVGVAVDVQSGFGRVHVVDAQVEGRTDFELRQCTECGHAAGGVHQGGQGTSVNGAGLGVTDDLRRIRQQQGHALCIGVLYSHL
ncbi:hypothetical protein D3C80_1874620 [compost metagenome]